MPLTIQRQDPDWLIKIDGQNTLASAEELKNVLFDWLAAEKDLQLDLAEAEDIDIATLQLLHAAASAAARAGVAMTCRASSAVTAAVRDSGFGRIPGFPISSE
jgi:anti-anti-sigma regulatory factor